MKQTKLNPYDQRVVCEQLLRMYPDCERRTAPLLIALPCGIHPYNRAGGYYDPDGCAIVFYQDLGRSALAGDLDIDTVRHELAHWHQCVVQGYKKTSTVNPHRHRTWAEACYLASVNLWPQVQIERSMFSPLVSARVGERVVKIARQGALSDVELHHWPHSMATLLSKIG